METEQNSDTNAEKSLTPAVTDTQIPIADKIVDAATTQEQQVSKGDEKAPETLGDAIAKAVKAEGAKPEDEAGKASAVQELDKTSEGDKEEPVEEAKGPVPYERFDEVVKEKNDLKKRYEEVEPMVKAHQSVVDYCQQYGVSAEQYQQALELVALINTEPQEALKRLTPLVEQLKGFDGETLPKDLQAEVEAGDISKERAQELASLRAKTKLGERSSKHTVEQQEKAFISEINRSVSTWDKQKQESDPDYRPKVKESEPDGKYELVQAKVVAMLQRTQVKSVQDIVALTEKAYQSVSASLSRFAPPTSAKKYLNSRSSSTTKTQEPKTLAEVCQRAAAESAG